MFAAAASKIVTKLQPAIVQTSRQMSVISGPPQVRISALEKAIHGLVISASIIAVPVWVLLHLKHYRGEV